MSLRSQPSIEIDLSILDEMDDARGLRNTLPDQGQSFGVTVQGIGHMNAGWRMFLEEDGFIRVEFECRVGEYRSKVDHVLSLIDAKEGYIKISSYFKEACGTSSQIFEEAREILEPLKLFQRVKETEEVSGVRHK